MIQAMLRLFHQFWFVWHQGRARRLRRVAAFHDAQRGLHMSAVHNMGLSSPFNRALLEWMEHEQ